MAIKIGGEYYPSQAWYDASQQLRKQGKTPTTSSIKKIMSGPTQTVVPKIATPVDKDIQRRKLGEKIKSVKLKISTARDTIAAMGVQGVNDSDDLQLGQGDGFIPPSTGAFNAMDTFTQSMSDILDKQRVALDAAHQQQLDNIQRQKDDAEKARQELLDKQEDILETDVKPLTEPFRADIETAERERLKVEENFFANQALTNELKGLLTQIQADVQREKEVTGLSAIREPRIAQASEEMTARVGVIEATLAVRNNQISVANNLIDRTVAAMTADRQDQLNYYNAVLSFYDSQKDFEGNKIIQLTSDEKKVVQDKVNLIEQDMNITLQNVENIKAAMLDPDTAMAYAQAGVTLNDSPEVINEKLGKWAYTQELANTSNSMAEQGYKAGTGPAGSTVVTTTDSQGNTKTWYKDKDISTTIAEIDGRQVLINAKTGAIIKDLGIAGDDGISSQAELLRDMRQNITVAIRAGELNKIKKDTKRKKAIDKLVRDTSITYPEFTIEEIREEIDKQLEVPGGGSTTSTTDRKFTNIPGKISVDPDSGKMILGKSTTELVESPERFFLGQNMEIGIGKTFTTQQDSDDAINAMWANSFGI